MRNMHTPRIYTRHRHIKLQLNGGVQNLFNAFQKDLDKGGFRDSGYFYGPTQPRTYFIGVKITN
jgi:outer membrane receptor for ferrienterochelin and colicins